MTVRQPDMMLDLQLMSDQYNQGLASPLSRQTLRDYGAPPAMSKSDTIDVTFQLEGGEVHACMARPGESLLDVALRHGIAIEHTCGGVGACSTCHVWIDQGSQHLSLSDDNELDRLDEAVQVRLESRLACQAKITGPGPIICTIPQWNRNIVREAH